MLRSAFTRSIAVWLIGSLAVSLAACVTRQAETMPLEVRILHSSVVCGSPSDRPAATWLDTAKSFSAAYGRLTRSRMNQPAPPAVNFSDHGVLLIEMGRRRTGGYSLSLASNHLEVTGDRAQVHVAWIEPDDGAILPQIVTSPCLMLEIPRAGYSLVQVVDQSGIVRLTADIGE